MSKSLRSVFKITPVLLLVILLILCAEALTACVSGSRLCFFLLAQFAHQPE